jgi:two-component system, cell cycle sensor histidine kinase and response regulator CckA
MNTTETETSAGPSEPSGIEPQTVHWLSLRRRGPVHYVLAAAMAAGTLLILMAAFRHFGNQGRPILFMLMFPIVLSAYLGGLGPGLFSTTLSVLLADYFMTAPIHSFRIEKPADYVRLGALLAAGSLVSVFSESLRRARTDLQNANEALRASEELQSVTLASIGDGVIATDENACVNYMNAEAERLTGWPSTEARGAALSMVFHIVEESRRRAMEDPATSILRSGKATTLANHTLLVARDGRETPIADCGSPIADTHGKVLGVVLVFRDCSVQRQVEKTLQERLQLQEQLAKVAESAPGVICSFQQWPDGRTCFPYASPSIEKMYGISREDLGRDGNLAFQRMHPDDIAHVRKTIAESAAKLALWRDEFRISLPDGNWKWISGRSMPQRETDGSILWHGVLEDVTEQKLQEQKLKVSEDHFHMLVVGVRDYAIFMLDTDGNIATWNLGAERIKGWKEEEIVGRHFSVFYSQAEAADAKPQRELQIARSVGRFEEESWRYRKDGSRFWASVVITPLRDAHGREYGFAKVTRDMTERRRIERAIKEDEARLASVIGSAMDAIITVDEQHNITLFNPAAESMFGCKSEAALGQSLDRFMPKRFRGAHAEHIRKFGETQATRRKMSEMGSIYGLRTNGEEFPIEASISQVAVGGQKLFTVILRDITERMKAEEELRQQASLLSLATVLSWDMDKRIVLWTRGAEQFYGYSQKEALGRSPGELLQTEFPMPLAQIERALYARGGWEGELIHTRRDGSRVSVASKWILHRNAQGEPSRILEMNQDITAFKKAQALQLSSQKLESLGTLSGGIAHDFNNILQAINGNAKLAIADLPEDHPVQESLREIAKAGERATDLVRRILAFSRPTEQKRDVQPMQPVVEEAVKLVRATLRANIEIKMQFQPDLPAVAVDATQIHQVIVNLATNAAHAIGDRGGVIDLRLDSCEVGPADLGRAPGLHVGNYVRFCVGDNGCGMNRDTLARIYDPFFSTKPVGQGTGLGLSVVHGIVSSHDGALTVYSDLGRGTQFYLYFPAASEPVKARAPEAPQAPRTRHGHILYLDDEEALVMFATRLLTRLGFRVSGFTDAAEALHEFGSRPAEFDAVVTDLSMPKMTGLEFAREVLAIRPSTPVVVTSGYVRPEDQVKAQQLGIRDFILKPVTADQLATTLDQLLQDRAESHSSKITTV